jgi:hypothetical protein
VFRLGVLLCLLLLMLLDDIICWCRLNQCENGEKIYIYNNIHRLQFKRQNIINRYVGRLSKSVNISSSDNRHICSASKRNDIHNTSSRTDSLSTADLADGAKAAAEPMRAARIAADFMVMMLVCVE